MKEIGILFKADMVTAILAGRKNQTRRICKPQPEIYKATDGTDMFRYRAKKCYVQAKVSNISDPFLGISYRSRFGEPGDLLYVKETWGETTNVNAEKSWPGRPCKITDSDGDETYSAIIYRADGHWEWCDGDGFSTERSYWKSPLFLKKKDARIWLRNTGVGVERLNDISEQDAVAEGIQSFRPVPGDGPAETIYKMYGVQNVLWTSSPRDSFRTLIQSIHGDHIWNENPFCWVVSFDVLSTTGRP